jgi:hypothetical protein
MPRRTDGFERRQPGIEWSERSGTRVLELLKCVFGSTRLQCPFLRFVVCCCFARIWITKATSVRMTYLYLARNANSIILIIPDTLHVKSISTV